MAETTDTETPAPEYVSRKGQGRMDDEEFAAVVKKAIAESVSFVDNELSYDRAKATEYYLGKPFGNEEEGRSQVVMTDVRDTVDGMVPSLLRVFFGAEHAVEYEPTRPDTVEMAAQMTDYVRYVFEKDGGFLKSLAVLKDGLIRKIGIFKAAWDTSYTTCTYRQEGLDDAQLKLLAADDEIQNMQATKRKKSGLYDVEFTRKENDGCARVWELPPEEFIYNREARSLDTALLVMHRTRKTRGELLAMGISKDDLDEYGGTGDDESLSSNAEEIARRDVERIGKEMGSGVVKDPEMGKANGKITYCDGLMRVDVNGDGVAELRRVHCIGPSYYPVKNYPADDSLGFSVFTPYPEPHMLLGGSVSDRTMDIQKIDSMLIRSTLDSLSASIFPRTAYLEGAVSPADIMNTAIGAPMRVRGGDVNNAIRTLEVPFVGKEALPVLEYMKDVIERRTGRNKGAAGLEADALQSTGKEAVGAVLTGSQEQLEMIARVFAEMTLKPLFKIIGKLMIAKQPRKQMVRLRGKWVEVDPRTWDADMDVTVNVGLGTTFVEQKVNTLMALVADQDKLAAETGGPMSPVAPLPKRMNTRAQILKLRGVQDVESHLTLLPADWQPPPQPAPPPSPEQLAMEGEKQMNQLKTVKELAVKQDELALEREKFEWEKDFEVRKWAADVELRKYQIDAEYHGTMTQAQMDANIATEKHEAELTIQAHDQLHDQAMERDAQSHDQQMAERAADTNDAAQQAAAQQPTGGE
jgi:hypothetical protein